MLRLKLNHVSKRGYRSESVWTIDMLRTLWTMVMLDADGYVDLLKTRVSNSGALCSLLVAIDLMQQATHPMWDYVRGRLWKQAAVTHSIDNSGMDGSRHVLHDQRVILLYIFWKPHIVEMKWEIKELWQFIKVTMSGFFGKDSRRTASVFLNREVWFQQDTSKLHS